MEIAPAADRANRDIPAYMGGIFLVTIPLQWIILGVFAIFANEVPKIAEGIVCCFFVGCLELWFILLLPKQKRPANHEWWQLVGEACFTTVNNALIVINGSITRKNFPYVFRKLSLINSMGQLVSVVAILIAYWASCTDLRTHFPGWEAVAIYLNLLQMWAQLKLSIFEAIIRGNIFNKVLVFGTISTVITVIDFIVKIKRAGRPRRRD